MDTYNRKSLEPKFYAHTILPDGIRMNCMKEPLGDDVMAHYAERNSFDNSDEYLWVDDKFDSDF
jgi:hypothetical protein